ncbi:mannosylglycoprotein endo-beta-mannosidase isoform X1 [Cryptomeria japonica]|uniref:mannosylglycoprotein endo-beta-mannosidase isoform X1 n=2 Tax=Cryptomeria japonica TaxID=3369 RepID=UPI0025ABD9BE|nr:mannosylglycoprotein endo-beta-mannosidase isoform X1 [Cryptomeria japonica]XP_057821602.1 mannosylglycoprotein endo-beta-mannosidase isoform X1 [Cryptomeria japonica]XP_057821603.1 mannosylglycoprotein endo-beta-mannosidase isoform X1 [Cryptomeria japonica]XP_057821604.1 mannosylglycoprotein endo-beta-mannosidase isoform X1 [Cryptomeria japonica]XP_057821605.1 mannosylglycoprotein endo-beta-mannosidase isoform X1 [Cryptomeria japonica]XP_057821606.1 mannosylglycoprotein endo-beta-mannosida
MKLDSGWIAARWKEVSYSGEELTTTHPPSQSIKPWMEALVPGTVLGTLLKNKLIPDPFYGLENEAILDIADSGREYYTFWFFTRFQAHMSGNAHAWLNFRGINYSAEVYLNGHKNVLPKGMFRRHTLDVTDILHSDGDNFLAVLVYPPDHPGCIPIEGGQGGDHDIGKDVATQYVQGWDWMAPIRDRNTGIWDEVSISFTGPVKISDPHLVSSFFDDLKRVYLHTTAEYTNASSLAADCTLKVQVSIELEDGMCLIEHVETQELAIPGGTSVLFTFQPLFFYRPNLWWPNGLGKQALYKVDITVDVKGYEESDSWSQLFGFRKIDSHIDPATGGRLFKVNGEPVFIRGGNWILSDGLLRLSEKRYETDIKFHAEMNFNMIRCWGGGLAERPEFYHYCDVYGLLVWQEFWITGDVDGRGIPVSNPDGPMDHNLFLDCARDTIKLLRNHASLALWVGGNEQHPPEDINTALKNDLKLHPFFKLPGVDTNLMDSHSWTKSYEDPSRYLDGTRLYIQGSLWDGFANGKGDFTDGPYEIQYPEDFFKDNFYKYGFNPEVGSVGIPVAATIRRSMPQESWQIPLFQLSNGYIIEVPNPVWDYHKYIPYSKPGKVHNQIVMYGEPKSLDDFCEKAQLVNYIQYRALLEGWTSRMWTKYTGVLIWKTQNPWTGLRGQFYDHFHDQTAGFYGARSAAEPIHVQLNLATYFVEIVNTTSSPLSGVIVDTSVWELEGSCPYHKLSKSISVPPKKTLPIFEMEYPKTKNAKPVYFLVLKLLDKSNSNILSRNFYWLHLAGGDYKPLEAYRSKRVPIRTSAKVTLVGQTYKAEMKVHNLSKISLSEGQSFLNIEHHHNQQGPIKIENSNTKLEPVNEKTEGLLSRISSLVHARKEKQMHVETKGDHSGVAFFLHFAVHATTKNPKTGEDERILPVHYSDNYFSLVPGEVLPIDITFEVPTGTVPKIVLQGWNTNGHSLAVQVNRLE